MSFFWLSLIFATVLISAKTRMARLKYYLVPLCCFILFIVIGLIDGHFQVLPGSPLVYIKIGTVVEFIGFTYFMGILIKNKIKQQDNLQNELRRKSEALQETSKKLEELK